MTDKHWRLEDYLLDFPDVVVREGPVTATPIHHKVNAVAEFLLVNILPEARRCLNANAEIAPLLLTIAAVDYMAGYYAGRQSKSTDFKEFVVRYFPFQYRKLIDPLYDQIRSGLVHNLVIANPWKGQGIPFKIHPSSIDHLSIDLDGNTIFSVSYFLEDTRRAWIMYQYDLIMKGHELPQLVKNFHRRFNRLDGTGALMVRVPN